MLHYRYYADVPDGMIDALIEDARLCRLVTQGDAFPRLGLYPFSRSPGAFALHLHRSDEQLADLRARPRCLIEFDEPLASIPSHWVDPEAAVFATAYHRTVSFECTASLVETADGMAQVQRELMARYQPEGGYRAVEASDPMYTDLLEILVGLRMVVEKTKVKFKLGQNRDFETRALIARRLRERGEPLDARTAELLEETIALGWSTQGRPR